MLFNLVLAAIWFGIGLLLIFGSYFSPELDRWLRPFALNPGWVALGLAAYNVFRWWSARIMRESRARENNRGGPRVPVSQTQRVRPDPAFDFRDSAGQPSDTENPNPRPDMNV
jgi:hypothetical protein